MRTNHLLSVAILVASSVVVQAQQEAAQGIAAYRQVIEKSIAETISSLVLQNRKSDPFGFTPPNLAVFAVDNEQTTRKLEPGAKPPTFLDALTNLKIDGIEPANRQFYSGFRSVGEGEVIAIVFRGTKFIAKIESVGQRDIVVIDTMSGEKAAVRINIIPAEILGGENRK